MGGNLHSYPPWDLSFEDNIIGFILVWFLTSIIVRTKHFLGILKREKVTLVAQKVGIILFFNLYSIKF